jgi:hypothetical protein
MEKAWDTKTMAGFRTTEVIWLEFTNLRNFTNPYLTCVDEGVAVIIILEFVVYLNETLTFTASQIVKSLTNLRGVILIHGGCASAFSSDALAIARRSVRNISASLFKESIAIEEPKKPVVQLPVCVEFMDRFREQYWTNGSITQKMTYIASMISFLRGLRISNVAATGSKSIDHRYYLRSVHLEIEQGIVSVSTWKTLNSPAVLSVRLVCESSKTHGSTKKKKSVAPIVMIAGVGSPHEQLLMHDFVTWLHISGMIHPHELLFARMELLPSRKTPTYKQLQSKDVSTALKLISQSFNMNPTQFSTRSLRIGANVELTVQGSTDGQRMNCLDHVSLQSNVMYMRPLQSDPTPLSQGGALTMDNVKKIARYL